MTDDGPAGRGRREPTDAELTSAIPQVKGRREIRVGVFVVTGIVAVVWVLFLLTDPATLRGRYLLVTRMENAGGIRRGDPVQMRGVNIGRIHGFEMGRDGAVQTRMEIEGDWEIPSDSYTRLVGQGVFGGRTLGVVAGSSSDMAEPWDTIPSIGDTGGILETAEALGTTAADVLEQLKALLDDPSLTAVQGTVTDARGLIAEIRGIASEQRDDIQQLTASLNRSAGGLESAAAAGPDVARAMARADSILLQLNSTSAVLDDLVATMSQIIAGVERGEGTLGLLTQDDSLYVNLNRAAEGVALLVEDLRENPGRYIRLSIF